MEMDIQIQPYHKDPKLEPEHPKPEIWIVGDLLLDAVVSLDNPSNLTCAPGHQMNTVVQLLPGGTAMHAAVGAVNAGFQPINVIAAAGQFGPYEQGATSNFRNLFEAALGDNVQLHLDVQPASIAITVLIHVGDDSRLLFSGESPYKLRLEHVLAVLNPTPTASRSFLYMSGYVLFDPRRTHVAQKVLRHSKELGITTVVDIVPHRIYTRISESKFIQMTESAQILISDVNTLARLFQLDSNGGNIVHDLPLRTDLIVYDGDRYTIRAQGLPIVNGDFPRKVGPQRGTKDQFAMSLLVTHFVGN